MKRFFMISLVLWLFCPLWAGAGLVDNGDGTISDTKTGLMWQQDGTSSGVMGWEAALSSCESLVLPLNNPYTDWHLPNTQELQSLVDYSGRYATAIDVNLFPETEDYDYWTSTTYDDYHDYVWTIHFSDGRITFLEKSANAYVRAVRWQNNDAVAVRQYTIIPVAIGQGIIDPGSLFKTGIASSPVLILTPYTGWHVEDVNSALNGTLAEDDDNPGTYSYTLDPVYGSGTVMVNFIWDGYSLELDEDGDGIEDEWELEYFDGNLALANSCSDFDGDGFRDIFEYQHLTEEVKDADGRDYDPLIQNSPHVANIDWQCVNDCYYLISDALKEFKDEPLILKIREGEYLEDLEMSSHGATLVLRGGYDDNFNMQTGFSIINGVVTISGGSIIMENIVIK
ncbi:MAG: DUF1566 domain-containing protein [Pseudomonadota bacterium]|nr:DUF1566 domain-containing protein [Pseudomonadota bacterium]